MTINITSFSAFEYHEDAQFYLADYRYEGSTEAGWNIFRNDALHLTLPSGYVLLKTVSCGICSTDIARHHLPFPLPQIIGHEVVAQYLPPEKKDNEMLVADINASHKHRASGEVCPYCDNGLENHCPDRLTLGIDRLPGGFAPYILVPKKAIIPLPKDIDVESASVIEPFAAALHAVMSEEIREGDSLAVVGPRRLGSLLILALYLWRKKTKINFTITAIIRNEQVKTLCELAGADCIKKSDDEKYDIVFDTSGSVSGFELALSLAKRSVHVKSTNGKAVGDLNCLTEMVIDELSLSALGNIAEQKVALDAKLGELRIATLKKKYKLTEFAVVNEPNRQSNWNRTFDAVVGGSIGFINQMVRNDKGHAAIKPKGALYWDAGATDFLLESASLTSALLPALESGIKINTSRCGDFVSAIKLFQTNTDFVATFLTVFISGKYPAKELKLAFEEAKTNRSVIKVLVFH